MSLLTRRKFLAASGATAIGAAAIGSPRYVFASPGSPNTGDTILIIKLGGGADGLHMAGPFGNQDYEAVRRNYAVTNGLPLNQTTAPSGSFSNQSLFLHPSMRALHDGLWRDGKMALFPATGILRSSIVTEALDDKGGKGGITSHFAANRYNANAVGRGEKDATGWVGRMVEAQQRAGAVGAIEKASGKYLRGTPTVRINDLKSLSVDGGLAGFRDGETARPVISQLVSSNADSISVTGQRALQSITNLGNLDPGLIRPNYPSGSFGSSLAEVATILRAGIDLQAATIQYGNFDLHTSIGGFAGLVEVLSDGLQQFANDTNGLEEITVLVTTEFGRTIDIQGDGGTQHGRARCDIVLGGGITGGVFGDYPSTLSKSLNEGDRGNTMPVTVDHRQIIADIVSARADVDPGLVLPGFTPGNALGFA